MAAGYYSPLYTEMSGTCGPVSDVFPVPFEGPNNTKTVTLPNAEVSTEVIMKGCTVHMTQVVNTRMGMKTAQIDGATLSVEGPEKLGGVVTITHFDMAGAPACSGTYDAQFSKMGGTAATGTGTTGSVGAAGP